MPRKSSVKRQTPEVREAIGQWHRAARSLQEIVDAVEEAYGVKLSRSAVHRHVQGLDKTLARVERSRAIAEAMVARFGTEPESKTARANIEIAHALIGEIAAQLDSGQADENNPDAGPKPMDAMLLAKAIDHLSKASKQDVEHAAKIRELATKEAESKMRARVQALGSAKDLKKLSDAELEKKIAELAAVQP